MLRKPGQTDNSHATRRPTRRKTQDSADEIVRKLQRLPFNKKCADCTAKLPQSVNLTHGTFVCMACSGVHREFNHRIKGIGHSSFTTEEAAFLSSHGNDVVNSKLLANFSKSNERLRPPDGSASTVDGQLLRVWLRRKYIDNAWKSRDSDMKNDMSTPSTTNNSRGSNQHQSQPTRVKIPSKKTEPAPATVDLLGDIFAEAAPVASAPAPVDDEWNAFGGSTSNTVAQTPFDTNFGQGNQSVQSQQQPTFPTNAATPPSNFQPTFNQSNFDPTSQPGSQQGQTNLPHQHPSSHPPAQYQHPGFNANFPPQAQPQQQSSSGMGQPALQGNLQAGQPDPQQQQMQPAQTLSQPSFNGEFSPAPLSNQPQPQPPLHVVPPTQQNSTAFNANFQNQSLNNQQHLAMPSGHQQPPSALPVHQQTQSPLPPQGQQQASYNTNASIVTPGNQQLQRHTTNEPPQQQHPQGAQSGVQQQQTQPTHTYLQPSFTSDYSTAQAGNQQLQPPHIVPSTQHNSTFTTNFQSVNQQNLNTPSVQQQAQNSVSPAHLHQPGVNANFADASPVHHQHPGLNTASSVGYHQPTVPSNHQQSNFNANLEGPQEGIYPDQQSNANSNYQFQQQAQPSAPPPQQLPPGLPADAHFNIQSAQESEKSVDPQQQSEVTVGLCENGPSKNINCPVQGNNVEMLSSSRSPQQSTYASSMNGVDSMAPTLHMQNAMPSTMPANGTAQNAFDAFNGLGLGPDDNVEKQNGIYHNNTQEVRPNTNANQTPSKYSVGQKAQYRDSQNNVSVVEIAHVHLDDSLVPFYTIKMPDGREKQTDDKHLYVCENVTEGQRNVDPPQELIANPESNLNTPVNAMEMPETNGSYPRVDDIVAMLHNLNTHQLAAVHGFVNEMTLSSKS